MKTHFRIMSSKSPSPLALLLCFTAQIVCSIYPPHNQFI